MRKIEAISRSVEGGAISSHSPGASYRAASVASIDLRPLAVDRF